MVFDLYLKIGGPSEITTYKIIQILKKAVSADFKYSKCPSHVFPPKWV